MPYVFDSGVFNLLGTGGYQIAPFTYQARGIVFAEWANLFTLCLAPLIAHVFGGVPKAVYLSPKPPRWHERLWMFNPTSILWRYLVITDRRIRAKSWTASDMAASNAYFWTTQGWDGSLQMLERSRAYCLRKPTHHRVSLFSGSTLTTIIITLQGIMAIKTLINGVEGSYAETINIGSIFYPLSVFGLLRILAAMWLTDDYLYYGDIDSLRGSATFSSEFNSSKEDPPLVEMRPRSTTSLLDSYESLTSERFNRTNSWRAIIFRIFYLIPICCLVAICVVYLLPTRGSAQDSLTTFMMVLFYAFFLAGSALIYAICFISGRSTNSIIPCHNAIWYKMYTGAVMAFMAVLILFACLETRMTPCGIYTTYPRDLIDDFSICRHGVPVVANQTVAAAYGFTNFGIIGNSPMNANGTANGTSMDQRAMKPIAVPFTGLCFGEHRGIDDDLDAVLTPLNGTLLAPSE